MNPLHCFIAPFRLLHNCRRMRRIGYELQLHQFSFRRKVYETPSDDLDYFEGAYLRMYYYVTLVPHGLKSWLVSVERRGQTTQGFTARFQMSEWESTSSPDDIALVYERDRALKEINIANRDTGVRRIDEFSFIQQRPQEMVDGLVKRGLPPVELKSTDFYYVP